MTWRDFPLEAARWLFLGAIVLGAWLYGGTREWSADVLRWLLLGITVLFAAGLALRRRLPRVPAMVALPSLALAAGGLLLSWNSHHRFDPATQAFVGATPPLAWLPGFQDRALTAPGALMSAGLLGCLWLACDLAANRTWRRRVWIAIAATGTSIMILGLAQKFTGATSILWDTHRFTGRTFFAVFRYHANAGAYINLVLPFILALAAWAYHRPGAHGARVAWTLAGLATAACGFINVSRAANVVTIVLLGLFAVWMVWRHYPASRCGVRRGVLLLTAGLTAAVVLAVSFGPDRTLQRWSGLGPFGLFENGRFETYGVLVRGPLGETGAWGYGPGTFEHVFNEHRAAQAAPIRGRWIFAHSDALQTPMDYGWVGAGCWLLILAGATWRGLRRAANPSDAQTENALLAGACSLALAGVLLHGLVDFPLQIPSLQILTMTAAGLAWGLREARD